LDAAFSRDGRYCLAAAVLWDLVDLVVVERRVATRRLGFPYVPGLLSFREAPALLAALRKLQRAPDVLMCDGQGLAHPRRFGIACHVGLICQRPAIGCAKSLLVGEHDVLPAERGARVPLRHRGESVGTVLRTQSGIKPVYVSVGHRMDLATAERLVLACAVRYRLPEPTRLADQWVAQAKKGGA
jgi:deoxyribonuclease V